MKLITLEDEYPVFNPEVRMIKEFRVILERDKGSKGDMSGRFKKLSTKELAYVHFMCYYGSEFVTSYSEDEREERVIKHLDLPEGWKCDSTLKLAMITYKDLVSTPSMESLVEAREALFSADKILKIFRRRLEDQLQKVNIELTGDSPEENEKKLEQILDKVTKAYNEIMNISKKMPESLDIINRLEERVKREMLADLKGKGKNGVINMQEIDD